MDKLPYKELGWSLYSKLVAWSGAQTYPETLDKKFNCCQPVESWTIGWRLNLEINSIPAGWCPKGLPDISRPEPAGDNSAHPLSFCHLFWNYLSSLGSIIQHSIDLAYPFILVYHTLVARPKIWKLVHLVGKFFIVGSWVIMEPDVLDLQVEGTSIAVHEGDGHAHHPCLII